MIAPILTRLTDDKDQIQQIRKLQGSHDKQIQDLEHTLYKTDAKSTAFDEVYMKIGELEQQRKIEGAMIQQQVQNFKKEIDNCLFHTSTSSQQMKGLDDHIQNIQADLLTVNKNISSFEEGFLGKLNATVKDLLDELDKTTKSSSKIEQIAKITMNRVDRQESHLQSLDTQLEKQIKRTDENLFKINQLQEDKHDLSKFLLEKEILLAEQAKQNLAIQDIGNNFVTIENFIEKYIPIRIQSQISETMNKIMANRERRKLSDYEHYKFRELHDVILEDNGFPDLVKQIKEMQDKVMRVLGKERRASRRSTETPESRRSLVNVSRKHESPQQIYNSESKQSRREQNAYVQQLERHNETAVSRSQTRKRNSGPGTENPNQVDSESETSGNIKVQEDFKHERDPSGISMVNIAGKRSSQSRRMTGFPDPEQIRRLQNEDTEDSEEVTAREEIQRKSSASINKQIQDQVEVIQKKFAYQQEQFEEKILSSIDENQKQTLRVVEELNIYIQNVQSDFEAYTKQKKKDKGEITGETHKAISKVASMSEDLKLAHQTLDHLSAIVSCIIEEMNLELMVNMQDEIEKQNLTTPSPQPRLHSQEFQFQQNRSSTKSGTKTLLTVAPATTKPTDIPNRDFSPITSAPHAQSQQSQRSMKYRNKELNREQVYMLRSTLIQKCAEIVNNTYYPFKLKGYTTQKLFNDCFQFNFTMNEQQKFSPQNLSQESIGRNDSITTISQQNDKSYDDQRVKRIMMPKNTEKTAENIFIDTNSVERKKGSMGYQAEKKWEQIGNTSIDGSLIDSVKSSQGGNDFKSPFGNPNLSGYYTTNASQANILHKQEGVSLNSISKTGPGRSRSKRQVQSQSKGHDLNLTQQPTLSQKYSSNLTYHQNATPGFVNLSSSRGVLDPKSSTSNVFPMILSTNKSQALTGSHNTIQQNK